MAFRTQDSSKPRIKDDALGDKALQDLYSAYSSFDDASFEKFCIGTVNDGVGKREVKDAIITSIKKEHKRDKKLWRAQNFILAGMGLGV